MIHVTRLDGSEVVVNCELLETVEHTPDTVITLLNGKKLVVKESVSEVIARMIEYRQNSGLCALVQSHLAGASRAAHPLPESITGAGK